jgi:hypothetical protein
MDTGPQRAWNLLRFEHAVPSATPSLRICANTGGPRAGRWGSNWTTTASKRVILTRSTRSEITSHRLRSPMPPSFVRPASASATAPAPDTASQQAAARLGHQLGHALRTLEQPSGMAGLRPGFGTKSASMRGSDESRNCEADCGRSSARGLLPHRIRLPTQPIAAASILPSRVTAYSREQHRAWLLRRRLAP